MSSRTLRSCFALIGLFALVERGIAGTNPAVEPEARDEKWVARHQGFVAEAKRGGVDVLFLGDSITDGWRLQGRYLWEEHFAPLRAANFGIDGDRTQNVLWRIEHGTLEGLAPKVVVLMLGTNNIGLNRDGSPRNTPDETLEGLRSVLDAIRAKLPATKILLLGIFPRAEPDSAQRARVKAVNDTLRTWSESGKMEYLDIGSVFLAPDGSISQQIMPDLLHPTEAGYALWAAAIKAPLARLLAN